MTTEVRADIGHAKWEWDASTRTLTLKIEGKTVFEFTRSGSTAAGTLVATTEIAGTEIVLSSQARGDIIRRGAAAWEVLNAKTSAQILIGDGTDLVSVAVSGDVTISAAGVTAIGATKVTAAMLGANLGKGHIPLDITTAKIIAGDAIGNTTEGLFPDGNTDPSLARVNAATDKALRLVWAAASVVEVQFAPIVYPGDLDDTAPITVHFLAGMAGAADTPTLTVGYFEGVGDTDAGGATGALAAAVAEVSRSIAHGDVGAHPKAATVTLTPGAHGTDALYVYAAWIEYTRKS